MSLQPKETKREVICHLDSPISQNSSNPSPATVAPWLFAMTLSSFYTRVACPLTNGEMAPLLSCVLCHKRAFTIKLDKLAETFINPKNTNYVMIIYLFVIDSILCLLCIQYTFKN